MTKNYSSSWANVRGGLGHHLVIGRKIMAHAWVADGNYWCALVGSPDQDIKGPFTSSEEARSLALDMATASLEKKAS